MNKENYLEILNAFIPSTEMQEYLASIELKDRQISSLILGAPVSLKTKLKYTTGEDYQEIKQALDGLNLKEDEHFYLFDNWYDEEFWGYEEFPNRPFYDYESVLEHIRGEIADCGEAYDETSWYTLRKMVRVKSKTKYKTNVCAYEYILIRDEVCYFRRYVYTNNTMQTADYRFSESTDLNLPVPFQVGDTVNIDCRPFAPVQKVKITEIGNNYDCCSLQAEYFDKKEMKYKIGAVKHCFIFSNGYRPFLSSLYRMSKVN